MTTTTRILTALLLAGATLGADGMRNHVLQRGGAYLVFDRPTAGTWRAYDAGIPGDSHFTCSIVVPAGVLGVWHWTAGTCHPPAA